VGTGDLSWG